MRVLHAYCLNHNIGDYYLGFGVKNLLRKFLPVELIAETNLQGTVFNEYYIDNVINKKYDLLVIGGGGIIHGAHWPNGWFWLIREDLISTIKIPFIIYGAGYNYFSDELGIPAIGKSHLQETIKRALFFSIRNDKSADRFLKDISINVPVVPDPGFHIDESLINTTDDHPSRPFVVIQVANDKPEYRFKTNGLDYFVNEMRKVVMMLSKKYTIVLAPHVYEDISLSKQIIKNISNCQIWPFHEFAFDKCNRSLIYYKNAKFVLAMRGHAQIVPISFKTPVISLQNHPKHVGLMEELNLHEYNVTCADNDFANGVIDAIELLEKNYDAYCDKLDKIAATIENQTKLGFEKIISSIQTLSSSTIN